MGAVGTLPLARTAAACPDCQQWTAELDDLLTRWPLDAAAYADLETRLHEHALRHAQVTEDLRLVGRCLTCQQWAELDPGSGRCPLCPWEPAGVRYRRARARQQAAFVFLRDGVLFALLLALLMLEVAIIGGLLFPGEMS